MKLHFYKILFLVLVVPHVVWGAARSSAPKQRLILFGATTLFGYGSSSASTDPSVPSIGSFTLGLALGVNIKKFSFGVGYDYRILTQYSEVVPAVGNRRGTFISPVSIFARLNFEKIKFGLMLINSGTYDLQNVTALNQKLSYSSPSGFRFTVNFKNIKKVSPGLFYESVDFSEKTIDGVSSPMTDKLNYANYGIGVRYEF